jgi:hypothetical protein
VRSSFFENAFRSGSRARVVDFSQEVEKQNVQYVSGTGLRARSCARVQFLGDLIVCSKTGNPGRHGQIHFYQAFDSRYNEVDFRGSRRAEVDVDRLPTACPVLNRDFDPNGIDHIHLVCLRFEAEREIVESELESVLKRAHPRGAIPVECYVQILGCTGSGSEPQLHGYSAFEIVGFQYAGSYCPLKDAAECKKGDPSS